MLYDIILVNLILHLLCSIVLCCITYIVGTRVHGLKLISSGLVFGICGLGLGLGVAKRPDTLIQV